MNFDESFDRLIGHEGGYANHPRDPGGETMWGVTLRVARANGYTGPMIDMPRSTAKNIYRSLYWDAVRADQLPDDVRFDVFDGAVNSGVKQAVLWLQRAAGMSSHDIDGVIGPRTIAASNSAQLGLSARYNGHRLEFMTNLKTWADFGRGWARRVASNLKESGA